MICSFHRRVFKFFSPKVDRLNISYWGIDVIIFINITQYLIQTICLLQIHSFIRHISCNAAFVFAYKLLGICLSFFYSLCRYKA